MKQQFLEYWIRFPSWGIILCAVLVFLAVTVPAVFTDQHTLLNLEPYPDGLYYINSARTLVYQGVVQVQYQGLEIPATITPLYSSLLAIGYLLTDTPKTFYLVNVALGIATLIVTLRTVKLLTKSKVVLLVAIAIYLSHTIVLWLPTVPMAENALLLIFSAALFGYFRYLKSQTTPNLIFTVIMICGLVFSKYTAVGPAAVLAVALLFTTWTSKKSPHLLTALGLFVSAGALFMWSQIQSGFNPLFFLENPEKFDPEFQSKSYNEVFYSIQYLIPNLKGYALALIGVLNPAPQFLWLQQNLSSFGLVGMTLIGLSYLAIKRHSQAFVLLLTFLAQFPILLVFYVMDQRYIILSLPLIVLGLSFIVSQTQRRKAVWVMLGLSLVIQVATQAPMIRELTASNVLHRSNGWQYQAVQIISPQLPPDSYLITVIPPLLIDIYQTSHYRLLPLSQNQEFMKQDQPLWGDIDRQNLPETYHNLLEAGSSVFITNAYLSSQHEFKTEYDQVFENFEVSEVSKGCFDTCNLYQLQLQLKEPQMAE